MQTLSLSHSTTSLASERLAANDKLAALVLALIEILLGLKDKDEDDKKLLAGLVGLLSLSGGHRASAGEFRSMELSQSSQVTQMATTTNATAVQASAYDRAAGGVENGPPSVGGNLNVVG